MAPESALSIHFDSILVRVTTGHPARGPHPLRERLPATNPMFAGLGLAGRTTPPSDALEDHLGRRYEGHRWQLLWRLPGSSRRPHRRSRKWPAISDRTMSPGAPIGWSCGWSSVDRRGTLSMLYPGLHPASRRSSASMSASPSGMAPLPRYLPGCRSSIRSLIRFTAEILGSWAEGHPRHR